jgi:hypothetical protein
MLATGIILYVPAILLPFVAAIILFARRRFRSDIFTLLLLLSCLLFTRCLFAAFMEEKINPSTIADVYFNLGEWMLLGLLFKTTAPAEIKPWFNYLLITAISSALTTSLILPVSQYFFTFRIIHAAILVILSLYCLFVLIRNRFQFIFQHPLFWIAGGTWFYYSMVIVGEWLQIHNFLKSDSSLHHPGEKEILLGVFLTVRLVFYGIASFTREPGHYEEEWKNLKESSREFLP